MPRNAGIGRTGKKHKKKALFDTHRQPKLEADVAESPAVAEQAASSSKNDELEVEEAAAVMAQATITSESESEEGAEEGSGPAGTSVQAEAEGPPCGEEVASEPEPEPEPDPVHEPESKPWPDREPVPLCPKGRRRLEILDSQWAVRPIRAALYISYLTRCKPDRCDEEEEDLAVARVQYQHTLRALKKAFPGEFILPSDSGPELMAELVRRCGMHGHPVAACLDPSDHLDEVVTGMSQPKDGVSSQDRETAHKPGATRLAPLKVY